MPPCSRCKGLDEAVPLQHGSTLQDIVRVAAGGCRTCDLVSKVVLAVIAALPADDQYPSSIDDLAVAWDTMRIDGTRIVVGLGSPTTFLFGIDLYAPKGDSLAMFAPFPSDLIYNASSVCLRDSHSVAQTTQAKKLRRETSAMGTSKAWRAAAGDIWKHGLRSSLGNSKTLDFYVREGPYVPSHNFTASSNPRFRC
jgi:hypothetical protein